MNKFRRIFVVQPVHDFSPLGNNTEEMIFLTTGKEETSSLYRRIRTLIQESFDPSVDAVVPAGKSVACLITGNVLGTLFPGIPIIMGVFRKDGDENYYEFVEVTNAKNS